MTNLVILVGRISSRPRDPAPSVAGTSITSISVERPSCAQGWQDLQGRKRLHRQGERILHHLLQRQTSQNVAKYCTKGQL